MQTLQTYQVADWGEFIQQNDIDLHCRHCQGQGRSDEGEYCEECGGSGYIEPLWNTIWNTGFHATGEHGHPLPTADLPNVFVFKHDDYVWFGLTCCGMDCTPHLAAAWLEMFPDCTWLPENFIVEGTNLRQGYAETCVGTWMARRIYAKIGASIKGARQHLAILSEDLKEARKKLAEKK